MKTQVELFKQNLAEFAQKHRKKIERDPVFRAQFQRMCTAIGVDPLLSSKGFFADLLGVGDFYYDLGVQIVDICFTTRKENGGLLDIKELKRRLDDTRKNKTKNTIPVSEDDIERAIKLLRPLGGGFNIVAVGGRRLVQSVPHELSQDDQMVMQVAQEHSGRVDMRQIKQRHGWDADRILRVFETLVHEGVLWIDNTDNSYWALCFFTK